MQGPLFDSGAGSLLLEPDVTRLTRYSVLVQLVSVHLDPMDAVDLGLTAALVCGQNRLGQGVC
jgi:hypothetical protein